MSSNNTASGEDQLNLWKNYADHDERQSAMDHNLDLQMQSLVHKHS